MEKGETPNQLLERLMTLTADIESCECDKTQDGFNMTKRFLVDKLLHALAPYHHQMVWDIRQHHAFKEMTTDDIISTFQLFEESKMPERHIRKVHLPKKLLTEPIRLSRESSGDDQLGI